MCTLLDLPATILTQHVLGELSAPDLCSVSAICRALRNSATQDFLWRPQCERWMAMQQSPSNGLADLAAAQLLAAFRLPTFRQLCQVLHGMGTWPGGVWYTTNAAALPCGRLLVVQLHPPSGSLQLRQPRPCVLTGPRPSRECWELQPGLSLRAVPSNCGTQASLDISSDNGLGCSLQLSQDGHVLVVHRSVEQHGQLPPAPVPEMRTIRGSGGLEPGRYGRVLASLAQYLVISAANVRMESLQYQRVELPPPPGPGPQVAEGGLEGDPPGTVLLEQYQGLWSGSYGPHGLEVLSLRTSSSAEDVPLLCPITGPRLQGFKLLGDPNVPALKHSFVADASSCRLGPYDPHLDDPFAPGEGLARPVLAFYQAATTVVSLTGRPVKARFSAVGCINVVPGLWQPEWVPAQLLLYDAPLDCTLTLIFLDQGEPFMHAIDLQEFPFAADHFLTHEC